MVSKATISATYYGVFKNMGANKGDFPNEPLNFI